MQEKKLHVSLLTGTDGYFRFSRPENPICTSYLWKIFISLYNLNSFPCSYFVSDNMEHYCNGVISFEMKQVYQARLFLNDIYLYDKKSRYSPYERYGYCETTIEGWLTKFPKFMFYFENINLDCDDGHLELYSNSSSNAHVKGNGSLSFFIHWQKCFRYSTHIMCMGSYSNFYKIL